MKSIAKKRFFLFLFLLSLFSIGCAQQQTSSPETFRQLHKNVIDHILSTAKEDKEVKELSSNLNKEGSWPDIDYTSQQRGGWPPADHLNRVLAMIQAYQSPQSSYYQDAEFPNKIHQSLNYWLDNDFICPNWFYVEIGIPMRLAPTLFLLESELSEAQKKKALKIMDRAKIGKTGQNKVWLAGNVLFKSLLLRDETNIRKAADAIKEELKVGLDEGIQPDWSFHQHGPQLQFGNYGLSYGASMIQWINLLRNTPFQFDESKMAILRNYLLEGQQWVTWKQQIDINACGRQLFVDNAKNKAYKLADDFTKMETLDPAFSSAYKNANQYASLAGNKHFWRSDFQVQRNADYYFSVKMCSERVVGTESCNNENIQGYYMGDGAAFLYQSGQEFENIFPFWDWKKIPGTTTHQNPAPLPVLTCKGYRIESDFVGGVSDGEMGIAVMDYKRDGLSAKKSWFAFEDIILFLGAGITSSEGFPVTTSVNQIFLEGEAIVKEATEKTLSNGSTNLQNPQWIWHNNTGYFFPNGGRLTIATGPVTGSWNQVASKYPDKNQQANLFKLWFEHGINPSAESYAYYQLPNATIKDLVRMESIQPYKILKNEADIQAVVSADESLAGIVFYAAGKLDVFGGIEADQPCLVMLRREKEGIKVSVADPTQKLAAIRLSLNGAFTLKEGAEKVVFDAEKSALTITLPTGGDAGRTVSVGLHGG